MSNLDDWNITIDDSEFPVTGHVGITASSVIDSIAQFKLKTSIVNGATYPIYCTQERWEYLNGVIKYRNSDIIVDSYPKCGTTWTEQTVLLLLSNSNGLRLDPQTKNTYRPGHNSFGKIWPEACLDQVNLPVKPGPEFTPLSLQEFDEVPAPRLIKSHAPLQNLLGTSGQGVELLPMGMKVIVVIRNPLDACVSSYYHAFNPFKCGWPFAAWAKVWLEGYFPHGDYFNWVRNWYQHAQLHPDRVLWLQYEDMLENPLAHVTKIASFIGCDASDQDMLQHVVQEASFDTMKEQAAGAEHMRKGICGDWRAHFTDEMTEIFKARFRERCGDLGLRLQLGEGEVLM